MDQGTEADREEFPWYLGVYDAHCHPTDSMSHIQEIPKMKARALTIMATRYQDQNLVSQVEAEYGLREAGGDSTLKHRETSCRVLPSFGWHPWFSHQLFDDRAESPNPAPRKDQHYKAVLTPSPGDEFIASLPEPRSLSNYLDQTRKYLEQLPLALVGEIGLDRAFRIPDASQPGRMEETEPDLTPGGREGRRLSPYRVGINHQRAILKAQLNLAGELGRAVSVHGVAAHGIVFETLQETWKGHEKRVVSNRERKRRGSVEGAHVQDEDDDSSDPGERRAPEPQSYPPRICLHSYSGPPEPLRQYFHASIPAEIFFSFSQVINFSTAAVSKAAEVIKAVPEDRILVESDLHRAGPRMDSLLEEMVRSICKLRGWSLEDGVKRLGRNWKRFALGVD